KRRAAGRKNREAWLVNCKSRTKPWGNPSKRRTWYRKRAKQMAQVRGTGVSAIKFNHRTDGLVSVESQQVANSRSGVVGGKGIGMKRRVVERKKAARS